MTVSLWDHRSQDGLSQCWTTSEQQIGLTSQGKVHQTPLYDRSKKALAKPLSMGQETQHSPSVCMPSIKVARMPA